MNVLDRTAKILDASIDFLNKSAFGNLYNFRMRPIGLYLKSYDFMLNHITRNIGNAEYTFDGYSTPIGEMANPFYNTETRVPWFFQDNYKNSTSNYLEYIRDTYGATISVENINTNDLFHLSEDAAAVGFVPGEYAIMALFNDSDLIPNINKTGTDTYMGLESGYYNRETLRNARVSNDNRMLYENHITQKLGSVIGLNTDNIEIGKSYIAQINEETGRFEDGVFSPLTQIESPVYDSNYGHYSDIGSYFEIYNSLSEKSKKYYQNNVYAKNKIYYPTIRDNGNTILNGKTYLGRVGISVGHEKLDSEISNGLEAVGVDELQIRYIFSTLEEHSNVTDIKNGGVYVYTENEYGSSTNVTYASFNAGTRFGRYTSYNEGLTANDLLKKTNESFKNGNYKTIIARFHTDANEAESTDTTQTAISKYGLSHGRNLLKVTPDESEGYENPYCRVWTFHHQYHRLADAIRPLDYTGEELYDKYNFSAFTADHSQKGFDNGRVRLDRFGSLNKNGMVNITPVDSSDASKKVDIRNCMFSIENLAWKDAFSTSSKIRETFQAGGLSAEQKGPFGGRIMWFPPYDLRFSENVSVNWNENNFIGRGEGIYTYTNTTRSGNLSFKILVDHPSIINYWENRGKSTSNSVDVIDDPEQQLLRFFAGCDMLTAKHDATPEPEPVIDDNVIPSSDSQILKFFVFYPNNYSGVDDDVDFAMKYLTNGLGAGKEKKWHYKPIEGKKCEECCYIDDEVTDYEIQYANAENRYGGYEMRPGMPISIVREQSKELIAIGGKITDVKVGDYGNGICCNNGKTTLYIMEGDGTDIWWQRKWYYRIDKAYKNQDLKKESYVDKASYCLNSKAGREKVLDNFGIKNGDNVYSFADVYVALEGGETSTILNGLYDKNRVNSFLSKIKQYGVDHVECIGRASVQGHNNLNSDLQINRARTIKKWLSSKQNFDGNNIKAMTGGTGGEGAGINLGDENSITNKLWRCAEVNIYLKNSASKTVQASLSERNISTESVNTKKNRGSNENSYHQVNYLNTPQQVLENYSNIGIGLDGTFDDLSSNRLVEQRHIKERLNSIRINKLSDNINGLALNLRSSVRNENAEIINSLADMDRYTTYENRGKSESHKTLNKLHDNAAQDEKSGLNNTQQDKTEVTTVESRKNKYSTREGTNNNEITRYDNEAKFFSMLEKEEPFLHHKISDKIKYFDPAFHSISPEGFNARLTFLQQCTRQGPTIGNSDNYTADNTANNLAFGRPPVCILRIGDFYYTKILIDSMTINFDPLMWDLNTEGIGVMPMIANIDLNFKFIGGSSLAGHISRLQNALSFNYYANTEVYDNRSELAEYDENGNIERLGTENLTL